MPEPDSSGQFWPYSWSADGKLIAGSIIYQGSVRDLATFSLTESRFHMLGRPTIGAHVTLAWLADSRRLLFRDRRGIFLLDTQTLGVKPVLSVGGYLIARSLGITSDNRNITYTETATSGDIWMIDFGPVEKRVR